ncbi:DUF4232 domain-containing protein [Corynebacterium sp.]|uniref:DUF4232 domain-containing protein n=1 Tax=Corynebacterium sp. TaxID=1720 RepID=UPI0026DA972B|nr:DUF4232 domain-containing protein [Corynebacterium sp.]MDO5032066.1 DUF4232 domain-containing protein [Corynebacterium sp.]
MSTPRRTPATAHPRTFTRRRALPVVAAVALAAGLSACSGGDDSPADSSAGEAASTVTTTQDPSGGQDSSPDSQRPDGNSGTEQPEQRSGSLAAPEDNQPPRDPRACTMDQLTVSLGTQQGAAGSSLVDVLFSNTSDSPCTLTGFPGVSAVTNNDGTQLGRAATRENNAPAQPVSLAPGAAAVANVKITNVGPMDPTQCQPQPADGLRVYPPEETRSAFLEIPGLQGCAGDVSYISVQPVSPA